MPKALTCARTADPNTTPRMTAPNRANSKAIKPKGVLPPTAPTPQRGTIVKISMPAKPTETIQQLSRDRAKITVPYDLKKTKVTKSGMVMLSTTSNTEANKLKEQLGGDYRVTVATKQYPRIKVTNILDHISKADIEGAIGPSATVLAERTLQGRNTKEMVVLVPPALYFPLVRDRLLYFPDSLITFPVYPCTVASQCGFCLEPGHSSKKCHKKEIENSSVTCSHCATDGHVKANCPKANEDPRCINCIKNN